MQAGRRARAHKLAARIGEVRLMRQAVLAFALALALLPVPAWANSGIGYLMVSVPAVIISLLPVIFIEAPVLSRMLGVPLRRGLHLSAGANFRSTWLGVLIALGLFGGSFIWLVAAFVLSVLIEGCVLMLMKRGAARQNWIVSLIANLVSYLFIIHPFTLLSS